MFVLGTQADPAFPLTSVTKKSTTPTRLYSTQLIRVAGFQAVYTIRRLQRAEPTPAPVLSEALESLGSCLYTWVHAASTVNRSALGQQHGRRQTTRDESTTVGQREGGTIHNTIQQKVGSAGSKLLDPKRVVAWRAHRTPKASHLAPCILVPRNLTYLVTSGRSKSKQLQTTNTGVGIIVQLGTLL